MDAQLIDFHDAPDSEPTQPAAKPYHSAYVGDVLPIEAVRRHPVVSLWTRPNSFHDCTTPELRVLAIITIEEHPTLRTLWAMARHDEREALIATMVALMNCAEEAGRDVVRMAVSR